MLICSAMKRLSVKAFRRISAVVGGVLLCLSVSSCMTLSVSSSGGGTVGNTSVRQIMHEEVWVRKTKHEIIMTFGAPEREMSDGAEGTILIYEDSYSRIHSLSNDRKNVITYRKFVEFYIDGRNRCYKVRTNLKDDQLSLPDKRPWY